MTLICPKPAPAPVVVVPERPTHVDVAFRLLHSKDLARLRLNLSDTFAAIRSQLEVRRDGYRGDQRA